MHTRLSGSSILALTLAAVLGAGVHEGRRQWQLDRHHRNRRRRSRFPSRRRSLAERRQVNRRRHQLVQAERSIRCTRRSQTEGAASTATLKTRWTFADGQVVDESTQTIAPTGNARTEFHISKPDGWPVGKYKFEVFLNGASAATKDFSVEP